MSRSLRTQLRRAVLITAFCAVLGFGGVLDPTHAALLGCLGFAALALRTDQTGLAGAEWPARRFTSRAGGRNAVSDLAWQVFDTDRRVRSQVVHRVRALAAARLALLGLSLIHI